MKLSKVKNIPSSFDPRSLSCKDRAWSYYLHCRSSPHLLSRAKYRNDFSFWYGPSDIFIHQGLADFEPVKRTFFSKIGHFVFFRDYFYYFIVNSRDFLPILSATNFSFVAGRRWKPSRLFRNRSHPELELEIFLHHRPTSAPSYLAFKMVFSKYSISFFWPLVFTGFCIDPFRSSKLLGFQDVFLEKFFGRLFLLISRRFLAHVFW